MNRGRSSDSLDNGHDDIIHSSSGSSSPTDFTSDEETSVDNLFLMSGQPLSKSRSRLSAHLDRQAKNENKPEAHRSFHQPSSGIYPLSCYGINQPPARASRLNINEPHMSNRLDYNEPLSIHPSTSYYNGSDRVNTFSSRIPDVVPNTSSIDLVPNQIFGHRRNNQIENLNSYRSIMRPRRLNHRSGHSSTMDDENAENVILSEDRDNVDLFAQGNPQSELTLSPISGSSRGMNTIAVRMCSRLVECRSLIEAIEFVEQNRDIVENLTRIIREAPAFRDYDIVSYQIDYSVKNSFNPAFWLDREPVVTTADGNCQYHAVSMSLTGTEAYTPEVRLATTVAVIDNREWFDSMLKLIDRGSVLDLVHTIARSYSWGDETTLKAIAVAINRRIFLYTCNIGKKDYEMVKSLSKEELLDAFKEKKYRGGTGIHTYADPLIHVPANNYIMLFHKSEHFIAVLPTTQQPTMFEPYNPIVPVFS